MIYLCNIMLYTSSSICISLSYLVEPLIVDVTVLMSGMLCGDIDFYV